MTYVSLESCNKLDYATFTACGKSCQSRVQGDRTAEQQSKDIFTVDGLFATIEPTAVNSNGIRYTTSDHLGSPRVVTNSGASVISHHDYMPFGEELGAGIGGRTTGMGFPGTSDGLRQKFTQKERDMETGLDDFGARYYGSMQGRFTGVDLYDINFERQNTLDPEEADALFRSYINEPQHWNHYTYALNKPSEVC